MANRVLVTGSNRGIGLEFVRQYLDAGWRVYATCRHPPEATELQHLARLYSALSIHRLDITVPEDIMSICQEMEGVPIDVLINNAGIYFRRADSGLANLHYDKWRRTLEVNTLGTIHITEALEENISLSKRHRLIVALTNLTRGKNGREQLDNYYYRSSKAALNAAMQGLAVELKQRNIGILLLYPGEVMTRMGSPGGITPRHSVRGMREIIDDFSLVNSGAFFHFDGKELGV